MLASKFIEFVDICIQKNMPFALYRLPFSDEVIMLISKNKVINCSYNDIGDMGKGFVLHPFKESDENLIWFIKADVIVSSLDDQLPEIDFDDVIVSEKLNHCKANSGTNKEDYLSRIQDIVDTIKEGEIDKLVFSKTKTICPFEKKALVDLFFKMEDLYRSDFISLVNITDHFTWCGASPEILLGANDKYLNTIALAGTQRYNGVDVEDVVWGEKEIDEQVFVSEYIEERINKAGLNYRKTEPVTVRAAGVVHIKTEFFIEGGKDKFWDMAKVLHPTPAVCGTPQNKALDLILEKEEGDRSYYSGFLGPIDIRSERKLFVNLRCAKWNNDEFTLFVGGGITKDSIPEKEWDETEFKADTLIKLL